MSLFMRSVFRTLGSLVATIVLFLFVAPGARAQDSVIVKAMRDEMARSMEKLQLAKFDRPYFISYRLTEEDGVAATAILGSLEETGEPSRSRVLTIQLRVGDYAFDNTNSANMPPFSDSGMVAMFGGMVKLPLDNDYNEIRRQIWLATDSAYKKAIEDIAAKRATLQNVTQTEALPDFTREEPFSATDEQPRVEMSRGTSESLARDLSTLFRVMPDIYSSSVSISSGNERVWYLNSEGTSYFHASSEIDFHAGGRTQATDGMPVSDAVSVHVRTMDAFPSRKDLEERIHALGARLEALRVAPLLARYNGPVLFEGAAAAETFSQVFAPALVARRTPSGGDPGMAAVFAMMNSARGASLQEKIGARVLPEWLSVTDSPLLGQYGGAPLFVSYKVDDEGVRAHETLLVEGGILKTLLNGRTPVQGVLHSTGNNRMGAIVPSNLIVRADKGMSPGDLQKELLHLAAKRNLPFAIVVRRVGSSSAASPAEMISSMMASMQGRGASGKSILLAYKVFPDGHEELVRGAELTGLTVESFKDISAAGKDGTIYVGSAHGAGGLPFDLPFDLPVDLDELPGMGRAGTFASYIVPSLLFEDVTFARPPRELPKLPYSAPPTIDH